ncbi:MAG: hypothetical protein FWG82_02020 [Oscillospiraceae bacterium]|nr:hypothetical protein [Oscillospiraceae bacterium]
MREVNEKNRAAREEQPAPITPNGTVAALSMYFRASIVVMLLTAVGVGFLLADNGTRSILGTQPDSAVISSRDRQVEMIFTGQKLTLRFAENRLLFELMPAPFGNVLWLFRAVKEAIGGEWH